MTLRWLFGNFADPQYALSRKEQRAVSRLAHLKYMSSMTFFGWTAFALLLPVGLTFGFGLPLCLRWLCLTGSNGSFMVGVAVILLLFWVWSAWVYRFVYTRPIRRAMREHGWDVCVGCGYLLKGLDAGIHACPECGWTREPMPQEDAEMFEESPDPVGPADGP